jgi:curved DNA-binding protein CbpA
VVDTFKCYKVLDIEPGSTAERVRSAYIELARTWDPDRYVHNPILRDQAVKKRAEIDEAYHALCSFLPDIQEHSGDDKGPRRTSRDFKEAARETITEKSKAMLGVLAGIVLLIVLALAFYLLLKGRGITPGSSLTLE